MEWRHVSVVPTHPSVLWCMKPFYNYSGNFVHTTARTAAIVYRYVGFKISKYENFIYSLKTGRCLTVIYKIFFAFS